MGHVVPQADDEVRERACHDAAGETRVSHQPPLPLLAGAESHALNGGSAVKRHGVERCAICRDPLNPPRPTGVSSSSARVLLPTHKLNRFYRASAEYWGVVACIEAEHDLGLIQLAFLETGC